MGELSLPEASLLDAREWQANRLRLLWGRRRFFMGAAAIGLIVSTILVFLIPKSYTSTAQLMPPDTQSPSGIAMMAAMAAKAGGGLAGMAGDFLGSKRSGALFIGVLRSGALKDRLITKIHFAHSFGMRRVFVSRISP